MLLGENSVLRDRGVGKAFWMGSISLEYCQQLINKTLSTTELLCGTGNNHPNEDETCRVEDSLSTERLIEE